MKKIEQFEDLRVWRDAAQLGARIYRFCETGPLRRDFSAKDQLKRAAVSISNNIAEGFEYNNNFQFQRFLTYSKGSAGEIRSHLSVLKEAEIITLNDYNLFYPDLLDMSKQLGAFKRYLTEFESRKR